MHKSRTQLTLFFLFLAILLVLGAPSPVHASPSIGTSNYKPNNHSVTPSGFDDKVFDESYAYDWDNNTFADITYGSVSLGKFDLYNFTVASGSSTPPGGTHIAFVDFKMVYDAGSPTDDQYRIIYRVGGVGPIVLQDWTSSGHAKSCDVWYNQPEPADGTWTLAEVGNIQFSLEVKMVSGDDQKYFYLYEAWVTIYYYKAATVYVDPTSQDVSAGPFTVDINVTNVDDLYGWEFKLYYDTTILTATSVTGNGTGKILQSGQFFVHERNDTTGLVWASCSLTGDVPGVSGSGDLATITFTLDGSGTSQLDLNPTKLIGYDYTNKRTCLMTHTAVDGSVTVTGVVEFPIVGALEIALVVAIVYIWWTSRKKRPRISSPNFATTSQRLNIF